MTKEITEEQTKELNKIMKFSEPLITDDVKKHIALRFQTKEDFNYLKRFFNWFTIADKDDGFVMRATPYSSIDTSGNPEDVVRRLEIAKGVEEVIATALLDMYKVVKEYRKDNKKLLFENENILKDERKEIKSRIEKLKEEISILEKEEDILEIKKKNIIQSTGKLNKKMDINPNR